MWMSQVQTMLRRHHVKATFFLTGQALAAHPDRALELERFGHQVGINGYSEVDLANLADWQVRLHLSTSETLLAASAGHVTRLFRPPGAQPLRGIDQGDLRVARLAIDEGYSVVLADRVSSIWNPRRSAAALVRDVIPAEGTSAVIEFPTPPAQRRAIELGLLDFTLAVFEKRDTSLVTISGYSGLDAGRVSPVAPAADRWRGRVLRTALPALGALRQAVHVLAVVLLALGLVRMGWGVAVALRSRRRESIRPEVTFDVPVTVVIAALNERASIVGTLEAIRASHHRSIEVLVVDDGSIDGTPQRIEEAGIGRSGMTVAVVRNLGAGKPDALNLGILLAAHEVIVCIDADTRVEPDAISRLIAPFGDPEMGATSGHVLVSNPRGLIGRFQRAEYALGCSIERRLLARLGFLTCISGAIGAYRTSALRAVGGFSSDTCAEDTDVALSIQRAGWKATYAPAARAHTTVPGTVRALWAQRIRWSMGVAQSLWKHRHGISDRGRAGWMGRRAIPYLAVFGALSVLGPIVDAVAIFAILTARVDQLVLVWVALVTVTTALTAVAFAIDGQPARRAWVVPLQIVLYRPLLYLAQLRAFQLWSVGLQPVWRRQHERLSEPVPDVKASLEPSPPTLVSPVIDALRAPVDGSSNHLLPVHHSGLPDQGWEIDAFRLFAVDLASGTMPGALHPELSRPKREAVEHVIDLRGDRIEAVTP